VRLPLRNLVNGLREVVSQLRGEFGWLCESRPQDPPIGQIPQ
ncbi:hypothetical protein chiPu_0033545, partial [Chiloscyllium punctatum]|nr:hypothetical protein [Chiloscyllium punctatum]